MAHNLNEAGFTQVGNKTIAALVGSPLTRLELCLLLIVVRQTSGYHRASASLPLSFFCQETHAKKQNVSRALKALIRRKVIIETGSPSGRTARGLSVNENTDEWDFDEVSADETDAGSSPLLLYEEKPAGSSCELPKAEMREPQRSSGELPESHQGDAPLNIYKYKNKKEAAAVVVNNTFSGSRFQLQTAAATTDASPPEKESTQEGSLWQLFHAAFGRSPNYFEHKEIESLIRGNSNFTFSEAYEIYCQGIHKLGISGNDKKTVAYLSGIIRSMMVQVLEGRKKAAKARGTPAASAIPEKPVWEEGAFIRMWEEAEGKKFYANSQEQIQSRASGF